ACVRCPSEYIYTSKDHQDNTYVTLFNAIKKILEKIENNISKHYNISINQGKFAGQIVDHLHIHIIPRYENDGLEMWEGKQLKDIEVNELLNKLRC
ncbi:MAG: HIT family protein, partial [Candidatus Aenigmarchaeota archaeon]|nr:HIT family protein [Candidatus Aenigmarchaeota archaeon]